MYTNKEDALHCIRPSGCGSLLRPGGQSLQASSSRLRPASEDPTPKEPQLIGSSSRTKVNQRHHVTPFPSRAMTPASILSVHPTYRFRALLLLGSQLEARHKPIQANCAASMSNSPTQTSGALGLHFGGDHFHHQFQPDILSTSKPSHGFGRLDSPRPGCLPSRPGSARTPGSPSHRTSARGGRTRLEPADPRPAMLVALRMRPGPLKAMQSKLLGEFNKRPLGIRIAVS